MKKFLQGLKKDERGLTLVELLAVVVILAIVGAIAFVAIGNVVDNSRKDAHVANAQQVLSAAELYRAGGGNLSDIKNASDLTETLGETVDPWDSEAGYDFAVAVAGDAGEGAITVGSEHGKCSFDPSNKAALATGRDLCNDSDAG